MNSLISLAPCESLLPDLPVQGGLGDQGDWFELPDFSGLPVNPPPGPPVQGGLGDQGDWLELPDLSGLPVNPPPGSPVQGSGRSGRLV